MELDSIKEALSKVKGKKPTKSEKHLLESMLHLLLYARGDGETTVRKTIRKQRQRKITKPETQYKPLPRVPVKPQPRYDYSDLTRKGLVFTSMLSPPYSLSDARLIGG